MGLQFQKNVLYLIEALEHKLTDQTIEVIIVKAFTPEFLKWSHPSLKLDKSIIENHKKFLSLLKKKTFRTVSSGCTLFAKVSVLVSRFQRVNPFTPGVP